VPGPRKRQFWKDPNDFSRPFNARPGVVAVTPWEGDEAVLRGPPVSEYTGNQSARQKGPLVSEDYRAGTRGLRRQPPDGRSHTVSERGRLMMLGACGRAWRLGFAAAVEEQAGELVE
jgi:hypothetical protein